MATGHYATAGEEAAECSVRQVVSTGTPKFGTWRGSNLSFKGRWGQGGVVQGDLVLYSILIKLSPYGLNWDCSISVISAWRETGL